MSRGMILLFKELEYLLIIGNLLRWNYSFLFLIPFIQHLVIQFLLLLQEPNRPIFISNAESFLQNLIRILVVVYIPYTA